MTLHRQPPAPLHRGRGETTITVHPANIHVYQITSEQLENIANARYAAWLGLAFACLGTLVTLVATWLTMPVAPSEARLAVLTSLTVTFGLATVGFGVLAFQGGRQHKRALATLINQGVQND